MLTVGRSSTERLAYEAQLGSTHRVQTDVRLLALSDGRELSNLTPRLLDGQVDIDATAETTRSAQLTINDPDHTLHLDSRGLGDGAIYLDRLIQITLSVFVGKLNKWIEVPVFRGPVVGLARDGASIKLDALGMEHLSKGQAWLPMSFDTGDDVVATIKAILRDRGGERSFSFPSRGGRLPKPLALGRTSQPWATARTLAASIDRQLYYDGRGVCRLRAIPTAVAWTFKSGNGGTVLSAPDVTYDLSSASNLVWVRGPKIKGKTQVTATAVPPRSHPLSPAALGRNGVPRYLVTVVDNDKIRSKKDAQTIADKRLASVLREGVQVTFDALPVPHLDPLDPIRLTTPDASVTFLLGQLSIPLVHTGVMSVGRNRRVTPNRKAVRGR